MAVLLPIDGSIYVANKQDLSSLLRPGAGAKPISISPANSSAAANHHRAGVAIPAVSHSGIRYLSETLRHHISENTDANQN